MTMISVEHLTKDYGHGRGVFDISMYIEKGECYGFLGPNGAGKTTTIRHLMGFSEPQAGTASVMNMNSWENSARLQNTIGYLPGEIALPSGLSGTGFLQMMKKMRKTRDDSYLKMLLKRFELDPNIGIKQMSLGVKRKLAVVTAFMHNPDILILDEPTSGLDPVMQEEFIEFIKEEREKGKTVFLSSHIFHEVDAVCDRIAIIRKGKLVSEFRSDELKHIKEKIYRVAFKDEKSWREFTEKKYNFTSKNKEKCRARVQLPESDIPRLIHDIASLNVSDFVEIPFTLEDYFMGFYKNDQKSEEVR